VANIILTPPLGATHRISLFPRLTPGAIIFCLLRRLRQEIAENGVRTPEGEVFHTTRKARRPSRAEPSPRTGDAGFCVN
jgi:hypothetical protein